MRTTETSAARQTERTSGGARLAPSASDGADKLRPGHCRERAEPSRPAAAWGRARAEAGRSLSNVNDAVAVAAEVVVEGREVLPDRAGWSLCGAGGHYRLRAWRRASPNASRIRSWCFLNSGASSMDSTCRLTLPSIPGCRDALGRSHNEICRASSFKGKSFAASATASASPRNPASISSSDDMAGRIARAARLGRR